MARLNKYKAYRAAGLCGKGLHIWVEGQKQCRSCKLELLRSYNYPASRQRWNHRKRRYGIDEQSHEQMFVSQNGECLICANWLPDDGSAVVDHEHVTKHVRGLLCSRCNLAIGQFRHSPDLLRSAAGYLEVG